MSAKRTLELMKILRAGPLPTREVIEITQWDGDSVRRLLNDMHAYGVLERGKEPKRVGAMGHPGYTFKVAKEWRNDAA